MESSKKSKTAKTKILATLGPSSWDKLDAMVKAGLDGFRINMSHVKDYNQTSKLIADIRTINPYIFIASDLEGPKIRLGTFDKPIPVTKNQIIKIAPQSDCPSDCVPVQVEHMYKHLTPGNTLLINDGVVGLQVDDIKGNIIYAKVLYGTQLDSRKGVNIPDAYIPMKFLSDKDKTNLDFLVKNEVDYVSASFTQRKEDLMELREHMGNSKMKIIAKIENPEGIKCFDSILEYTDAVMVARGDLGMEIGTENVPANQKMMIEKCNRAGKMVITATQMLEGMITSLEAKRAEASDIFNAVLDGTDVVMLSGETSIGQYPVETVQYMNSVLNEAEKYLINSGRSKELANRIIPYLTNASEDIISGAVNAAVRSGNIKAIIAPTITGYTPAKISRFSLDIPVIALTNDIAVARQLNALSGIQAYNAGIDRNKIVEESIKYVSENNILAKGTNVIVVSGSKEGTTNRMELSEI